MGGAGCSRADTAAGRHGKSFRPQRLNKFHGRVSPRAVSAHGQVSRWLVLGEELTAAAFPALPQGRAAWALALWDTALVPSGPFRCDRPTGSTGTGSNHGIGGLRGTGPRCWANRGLCPAGMEGMGTWLRSGPFPSWGCFSPFSRCCRHKGHLVSAHLTCTHLWEFPQHPYCGTTAASGVQSQNCCRARQGESTGTGTLQRALIGSLGVTMETRPGLGDFGKANTGGTARIGINCRRHHGLPSAVSSRATAGVIKGYRLCLASERPVDSVSPSPASHLTCPGSPGRCGELLPLTSALQPPSCSHSPGVGMGSVKPKCWRALTAQGLPLASISPASGLGSCRAQRCRRSRQLPVKAKHDLVRAKTAAEPGRCPRAAHTQHIPRIHTLHPPLRAAPGLAYACDSHAGYF